MRKKKDLPLVILKSLEPFVKLRGERFEIVGPKENLLEVIDKDADSDFHFTIEQYQKASSGKFQFLMSRSPINENDNGTYQGWIDVTGLTEQFDRWIKLLDQYENVNSFFDDPIINSFQKEFYAEFEILDDEKEKPLHIKQILLLDAYLESVEIKLSEYLNDKNSEEITEIKYEITSLRENLTEKSKEWIVNKLTKIWGKIAKQGVTFIKEFLTESKKELIKQGIKGILDFVTENGHNLLQ